MIGKNIYSIPSQQHWRSIKDLYRYTLYEEGCDDSGEGPVEEMND